MPNNLVRYSRAGDEFHYRWAARRCLELLEYSSPLKAIYIEGDSFDDAAGEYVLDVTETYQQDYEFDKICYQLKYTTTRLDSPFTISELKTTLSGFSENYIGQQDKNIRIKYVIVTNRPISNTVKKTVKQILAGNFQNDFTCKAIAEYTKLHEGELVNFCKLLEFRDNEGNLDSQFGKLRFELSMLLTGKADNSLLNTLIAMVRQRALPDNNRKITPEDVLVHCDGISSVNDLFPAPPVFESIESWIEQEQYAEIKNTIDEATMPVVIHATGGLGKTVLIRQLANDIPLGSVSLIYDCFGAGQYRTPHKLRHRHQDALIQLSNELAQRGLCSPLLPSRHAFPDQYLAAFWRKVNDTISLLRVSMPTACVYIFIDAADNAEMMAQERHEVCFAHELLKSEVPEGCKLIFSGRTERLNLFSSHGSTKEIQLQAFNEDEVHLYVKQKFTSLKRAESKEIYSFTGGNPRVIANLCFKASSLRDLKLTLAPNSPKTVDELLNVQIEELMNKLMRYYPECEYSQLTTICQCLALLPPSIPIDVLAAAANVSKDLLNSFISDLGYPLWSDRRSVHFKDEPTETWFRQKYGTQEFNLTELINRIKPLGKHFSYVAEVIPSLLLANGSFTDLMQLAQTKDGIPEDKPAEHRIIYLSRLAYAVQAALKLERYYDAFKLAFLAGEEFAGNERQNELLQNNLALSAILLSPSQIQNYAWAKKFKSLWSGSENLYSAALLSFAPDAQESARGLLRSADHWLQIYFSQRDKTNSEDSRFPHEDKLSRSDIYIFALTILKLHGPIACADFVCSWQPEEVIFETTLHILNYLIDINATDDILKFAEQGKEVPHFILAVCSELGKVNLFLRRSVLSPCLNLLSHTKTQIPVPSNTYDNQVAFAIISFCEAATRAQLSGKKIQKILDHYYFSQYHYSPYDYNKKENRVFFRAFSLRNLLQGSSNTHDDILKEFKDPNKYRRSFSNSDIERIKGELTALLPWYELRCRLISFMDIQIFEIQKLYSIRGGYHPYQDNYIGHERSILYFNCLALCKQINESELEKVSHTPRNRHELYIQDYIDFSRIFYRAPEHTMLAQNMTSWATDSIEECKDELDVNEEANYYVDLASAIFNYDINDARAYFAIALETVSKYGEDLVPRWEAINALAQRAAESNSVSPRLIYRFAQCSEFVRSKVVRDKYFDRRGAISSLLKLSPEFTIATFSRRQDRKTGYFEEELIYLIEDCLKACLITSAYAWNLRGFIHGSTLLSLLEVCLHYEPSIEARRQMLELTVSCFAKQDIPSHTWEQLKNIQESYGCTDARIEVYVSILQEDSSSSLTHSKNSQKAEFDWSNSIKNVEFSSENWLSQAYKEFRNSPSCGYNCSRAFFQNLPDNKAYQVLQHIIHENELDHYDTLQALQSFPVSWRKKPSVSRDWQPALNQVIRKFSRKAARPYSGMLKDLITLGGKPHKLSKSLLAGLCDFRVLDDENYFAMIQLATMLISPEEAKTLMDIGITRFEKYIPLDFGDGPWDNGLNPQGDLYDAFAGLIWSALGSPDATMRWNATHCVLDFARDPNPEIFNKLFEWFKKGTIEAFGSPQYPFYELHAKLYFLMALARESSNSGINIIPYKDYIVKLASKSNHILIKKFASEIICKIAIIKNSLNPRKLQTIQSNLKSPFPLKYTSSYSEKTNSPWHVQNGVDSNVNFSIGHDIKRYWLSSLGQVFGMAGDQMEDLTKGIIHIIRENNFDGSWNSDPRVLLWRHYEYRNRTRHSHGGYPEVDTYTFYLCYHSIMILADKLLKNLPVLCYGDEPDRWEEWLSHHVLTRLDGRWLSDRRDAIPLFFITKNELLSKCRGKKLVDINLSTLLFTTTPDKSWISIYGSWDIEDYGNTLSCKISCAFVPRSRSIALRKGIEQIENPYWYRIPMYSEGREMIETPNGKFYWEGIIDSPEIANYSGLDENDPNSGKIIYPPHCLGEKIIQDFGLQVDSEYRRWFSTHSGKVAETLIWSSGISPHNDDREPDKHGELVSVSIDFLKALCRQYKKNILIEIMINNYEHNNSSSTDREGNEITKYFIFSPEKGLE